MKKILLLIIFSIITSAYTYNPDHLKSAINPNEKILKNLDLRGADLSKKDLSGKIFVSVDFRGANLSKSFFIGCYFIDCMFVDALVNNTIFLKAHFWGCNLLKMRGTKTLKSNFVLDQVSQLTMSGKEDTTLYPQYDKLYQIRSEKFVVSGLCYKIYDDSQKAIKNDD